MLMMDQTGYGFTSLLCMCSRCLFGIFFMLNMTIFHQKGLLLSTHQNLSHINSRF
nr:hypothetical protein Iba_chr11cCG8550 [Ipomoea batatas]